MTLNMSSIFPQGREQLINYNWTNVASAEGFILFDGFCLTNNTANSYHLLQPIELASLIGGKLDQNDPSRMTSSANIGSGALTKGIDKDFDSAVYQLPRTIRGRAIVRVSLNIEASGSAIAYYIVKFRKWNPTTSTETEFASAQSQTWSVSIPETEVSSTIPVDIPTSHINKGEQLRMTVEVWCNGASGTSLVHLAHNPEDTAIAIVGGANFTEGNTRLVSAIPFKIEV